MDAHPLRLWFSRTLAALRHKRIAAGVVAAGLALAMLPACGTRSGTAGPVGKPNRNAPVTGLVSAGDTLRLTFRKAPELNQTQRVRADGRVSLLQVGSVKAAGKSLDALQRELAARYELKEAGDLSISLEGTQLAVYVTGAVGRPGKVVLERQMTLLEAIMESGGFDRATANLKRVSLTRQVDGRYTTRWIDLRDPAAGGDYVQPYDMIEVTRFFQ